MGVQFSVQNSRHIVSMDLQDGQSILSFKVRDKKNNNNPKHFVHYKRYKYFQLPAQIRAKFKNVSAFHQHLAKHAQIITIGQKDIIIDLDGNKIQVPFENKNEQSKIFCESENIQMDNNQSKNRDNIENQGQKSIHIVIGNHPSGQRNNIGVADDEKTKDTLKGILRSLMKKNDPMREINFQNKSIADLASMIQKEWDKFEKNGPIIPNMIKKKTQISNKENQNQQIAALKSQLEKKIRQVEALETKFNVYKECFNFEKFNEEQRKNQEKFNEEQRKNQDITKKQVIDDLLTEMNCLFNRLPCNMNSTNVTIQITTKAALLLKIENMVKQLSDLRNNESQKVIKKEIMPQKINLSKLSTGFSSIKGDSSNLNDFQKLQISKKFDLDRF